MAKIILSGTMVRTPVGGLNLWHLAWLTGLKSLGHDVYFVEKSMWEYACYDVSKKVMTNDCSYGISVVKMLLKQFGLSENWCFVDWEGNYHGMSKNITESTFKTADLFIDFEWGEWQEEAANVPIRVFVDGEPGWFQIKLSNMIDRGESIANYDYYFTTGKLIENHKYLGPTAGIKWLQVLCPALIKGHMPERVNGQKAFSTIMNWKSNKEVQYQGKIYGQKDIEFNKFIELPSLINENFEVAVSGANVPRENLLKKGWNVRDADDISYSVKSYLDFIKNSIGEFSVAKNVFVETQSGWFGDRPAYYMSYGKPVVVQETSWTDYLPSGEGLFSFSTMEEAITAIDSIRMDYEKHSRNAYEIAFEYFEAQKVMRKFLTQIGI